MYYKAIIAKSSQEIKAPLLIQWGDAVKLIRGKLKCFQIPCQLSKGEDLKLPSDIFGWNILHENLSSL